MKRPDGKEEITQSEAGRRLGITPQSVGQYAKKAGAPIVLKGNKALCIWPDFPRWRDAELRSQGKPDAPPSGLAESQVAFEQARAEKMTLEVARMRGELVPTVLYQRRLDAFVGGLIATLTGRLARFERDILQAGTPADARRVTNAIRDQLMQGGLEFADTLEAESEEVTAA